MANDNYFIVEARLPVQIADAVSPEEAARKAARLIERQYGVDISNWYLRVFEYGAGEESGFIAEYFASPSGTKFRKIDENHVGHEELINSQENVEVDISNIEGMENDV